MQNNYPYPKWISTEWLENNFSEENLTIVDTQPDIHDYLTEHLPGAVYFNQKLLRIPYQGKPGRYVPESIVEKLFQRIGIKKDKPIIVYTAKGAFRGWGDGLEQTMIAYTLARFGHDQIYVLDGGLDKWKQEKRPLTKEFPDIKESDFKTQIRDQYYLDMKEVKNMKDNDDVILLDARPESMYEGQAVWIKPGHIPGAINLPWKNLMDDKNPKKLKSEDEIKKIIEDKGITKDKTIICSCGTGREATNEFLLFKWHLQYPNVKIYEGSFTEWTSYPENPVVTGKHPNKIKATA
ncbi:MAG: sulfurtransferase [Candidatus Thermoplasmatota archaeon]